MAFSIFYGSIQCFSRVKSWTPFATRWVNWRELFPKFVLHFLKMSTPINDIIAICSLHHHKSGGMRFYDGVHWARHSLTHGVGSVVVARLPFTLSPKAFWLPLIRDWVLQKKTFFSHIIVFLMVILFQNIADDTFEFQKTGTVKHKTKRK